MRGIWTWMAAALFLGTGWGEAQEADKAGAEEPGKYAEVLRGVDADFAEVLEKLAAQRGEIAKERPDLAKETNAIAAELREKRRRGELAKQERDALVHGLGAYAEKVRVLRDESAYIEGMLADFRRQMEAEMGLAEAEGLREKFLAADRGGEKGLGAMLDLAEAAAKRLPELRGPRAVPGEALDGTGTARAGRFVEAGPVSWFVADEGGESGLVTESEGAKAEVVAGAGGAEVLSDLADGRGGSPLFDPTLGAAVALGEIEGSTLDHIKKGGFWVYPILLLALVASVAAVAKWVQLAKIREMRPGVVRQVIEAVNAGDGEKASGALAGVRHPAALVLARGIEMRGRAADDVEEAIYEKYLEVQPGLQRGMPLIAIASATAPLLGLLGTVTGMIHTFKLINVFGTGDARSLSSGISEALITTEFGLMVAIPALIMHALLSRKIQGIRSMMEMTGLAYMNGLKERREVG